MRLFLCVLIVCSASGGTEADLESQPASSAALIAETGEALPGAGELRTSYAFTVKAGRHHSDHDFVARPHLGKRVDRALKVHATFAADAAYLTRNPAKQSDWNKLMGLTTDRIHKNSIRIGWRWNPASQRVELGFYGYLNGARFMRQLTDVAPGQAVDCELRMSNQGLTARAGNASHTESGSLGVSLPLTWVLHSVYFGGEETAPHDLHVSVSNVQAK
jgi:hypothetical protein